MLQIRTIFYLIISATFLHSCTKLDETFQGDLTDSQVSADSSNASVLLSGVYNSLQGPFTSHLSVFPLMELTTDEAIFPTRGGDWDDNGIWRALHQQKWLTNNGPVRTCFNDLNGISFAATDVLGYHPSQQEQAEARFIRAWAMYLLLDLFDQVPYRDPGELLVEAARVRKGTEALDYIISEINAVEPDLQPGPAYRANKFAAKFLLMKCYLNKSVYVNRVDPKFEAADMNKVVSLADEIINSNKFSFSNNYFDNFAPDNSNLSRENIFTQFAEPNATPNNNITIAWAMVLHYNQGAFGFAFNGVSTLSNFYDKFEPNDLRRGIAYKASNSPPNPGDRINVGFLKGQQYDLTTDAPLTDRFNNSLIFTPEVKNIELDEKTLEVTGIRPLKYFPDYPNYFSGDNDFVYFRFSDVLLMKAEAILRGGAATAAGPYGSTDLSIVNAVRTDPSRGATALPSLNEDILLDERGREMWCESWRRQDMIRFRKFLFPFQEKDYQSNEKYLLFPIPDDQLAVNPNLKQNPGY